MKLTNLFLYDHMPQYDSRFIVFFVSTLLPVAQYLY